MKIQIFAVADLLASVVGGPASANLLTNGGFEASSAPTTTPPGWSNIGHMDGVIPYSSFGPTPYEGRNFYDIGGFGAPTPTIGDGITQTVATTATTAYTLTFGFSGENTAGVTTVLDVLIGSMLTQFTIVGDGSGVFQRPLMMTSINYIATGPTTAISFTISSSTMIGFNDPLIDGVIFAAAGVPEPASWAMMIGGFGLVGAAMRRRKVALAA